MFHDFHAAGLRSWLVTRRIDLGRRDLDRVEAQANRSHGRRIETFLLLEKL